MSETRGFREALNVASRCRPGGGVAAVGADRSGDQADLERVRSSIRRRGWAWIAVGATRGTQSGRLYDFGGKLFTMYKFRTMQVNAEADGRAVWASKSDPRVTFVGRFLRGLAWTRFRSFGTCSAAI